MAKRTKGEGDAPGRLSSTVENYLKCLYEEQQKCPGELVGMGRIATAMQVSPGTATAMMKMLGNSGFVDYEPRGGSHLTKEGQEEALQILRRHRLVELFLVRILGLDWSEVHTEADSLEHAISDKVLARIDELLGFPTVDPHGDPIPSPSGRIEHRVLTNLTDCRQGARVRLARVMDETAAFLQLLGQHGLQPGEWVTVSESNEIADAITLVSDNGGSVTLGTSAATKLLVERDDEA